MRKYFSIATVLISILFSLPLFAFSGGDGTSANPYLLANKADIDEMRDSVNTRATTWTGNKYFKLTANIPQPITNMLGSDARPFRGNFDGAGHSLTLNINLPTTQHVGLFGRATLCTIKNLTLTGTVSGGNDVAAFCGMISSSGTIQNCTSYVNVSGNTYVGGFSGDNQSGTFAKFINCMNLGDVTGNQYVGGICGDTGAGDSLLDCTNAGKISGHQGVGGIVGGDITDASNTNKIVSCTNIGEIKGDAGSLYIGGINGMGDENIYRCVNAGLVSGGSSVGGISGRLQDKTLQRCINAGVVNGNINVGSIAGSKLGTPIITDCFYDIQINKYKAVNNQDHSGVTGLPTHLLMDELVK
ncbi:MAG: hypothetical protein LBO69_01865 [Ignavibacteria bacterium]|jgi:hypothetical protein|nr:hypothetical protein [Ignavibacteria bacterium]